MSDTIERNVPSVSADVAAGVAQFLTPVVTELTALTVNMKQLHWHVRGDSFLEVHRFLDTVVDHSLEWADLAAERIIALGLPLDGRLQSVAENTKTPKLKDGFIQSTEAIKAALGQIDAALTVVREALDALDDIDLASQDVAIEIERGLIKDRWFLAAFVAAPDSTQRTSTRRN